jgi:hypothetical protein
MSVCMNIYICICIYVYVYMYMYICICIYVHKRYICMVLKGLNTNYTDLESDTVRYVYI